MVNDVNDADRAHPGGALLFRFHLAAEHERKDHELVDIAEPFSDSPGSRENGAKGRTRRGNNDAYPMPWKVLDQHLREALHTLLPIMTIVTNEHDRHRLHPDVIIPVGCLCTVPGRNCLISGRYAGADHSARAGGATPPPWSASA